MNKLASKAFWTDVLGRMSATFLQVYLPAIVLALQVPQVDILKVPWISAALLALPPTALSLAKALLTALSPGSDPDAATFRAKPEPSATPVPATVTDVPTVASAARSAAINAPVATAAGVVVNPLSPPKPKRKRAPAKASAPAPSVEIKPGQSFDDVPFPDVEPAPVKVPAPVDKPKAAPRSHPVVPPQDAPADPEPTPAAKVPDRHQTGAAIVHKVPQKVRAKPQADEPGAAPVDK